MDEKYKIYCKKISDVLKNALRDNPKHFWNLSKGRPLIIKISPTQWRYFSDLERM
jgi:hypothetical protein